MGEARRRGTFEERKAQAIAEGRIKRPAKRRVSDSPSAIMTAVAMSLLTRARVRKRTKR